MGLANNNLSSVFVRGDYLSPDDRYRTRHIDYELGGVALYDSSQGLQVQVWSLEYIHDEDAANYGDFILLAEDTNDSHVLLTIENVRSIGLAFDQNMRPFVCYDLEEDQGAFIWWWDSDLSQQVTTALPSGAKDPRCCLDDKRRLQTGNSDILCAYIQGGGLWLLVQRERYLTPHLLTTGITQCNRIGMTKVNRVQYDCQEGLGIRLSEIVEDLTQRAGVHHSKYDCSVLYPIIVPGNMCAGNYSCAEAINALRKVYHFDYPVINGVLTAVLRGGPIVDTIAFSDFLITDKPQYKSIREQEVEFPRKVHLQIANAESDYTPHKQTAERLSTSVTSNSELTTESAVNFSDAEAAQRVETMLREAWTQREGRYEFATDLRYAHLTPSDPINLEVMPGIVRRVRIEEVNRHSNRMEFMAVRDRATDYVLNEAIIPPSYPAPTAPPSNIPGETEWYFLDLPVLDGTTDTLHYYVVGYAPSQAWSGAQVQREIGGEFENEAQILSRENLGELDTALAYGSRLVPDTTNTVTVTTKQDLFSVTDAQLYKGKNACVIGDELVQFRDVEAVGENQWKLSHLLRGRLNTTPASHSVGARFIFLGNPTVTPASAGLLNTTLTLRAPSFGTVPSSGESVDVSFTGNSQREWSPVDFEAVQDGSDWVFTWTPRYRLGTSANPVKSVHQAGYRIKITEGGNTFTYDITDPAFTYTAAAQTTDHGSAQSSFDNVQVMALNSITGEGQAHAQAVP